jgi:hypothetical protein
MGINYHFDAMMTLKYQTYSFCEGVIPHH